MRSFIIYAGSFWDETTPFYLIINESYLQEALIDLRRIGLDSFAGFFSLDIVDMWAKHSGHALGSIPQVSVREVAEAIKSGQMAVIDVRGAAEFAAGHLRFSKIAQY